MQNPFSIIAFWTVLPSVIMSSQIDCPCELKRDFVSCQEHTIDSMPLDFQHKCPDLMEKSSSIRGFDLKSQTMTEVLPYAFNEFNNLVAIVLSFNQIQEVHDGAFDGLNYLTSLSLSHNNISKVPNGVFDKLISLHQLDLSYNPIENFTTK